MATGLVRPGGSITALLGPTNTGKTHQAVERMLEHSTGMIGLPLRLLAREIYDKVSARVGESAVGLVTGEEKRVPRRPRYWICTTEAMPMGQEVDFVAVDEIQLAAHRQRGHVFTDRLLHARGLRETWLLGADTMRQLVAELVPTAVLRSLPRLSTLRAVAPHRLAALPARSAVIAFSVPEVYRLADHVRRRRGGAAVVLGALSPRTRNAQVAMFQAGEVDCLVATDAIGMGLNLDIGHVAFAELRKFDGREPRALSAAEIGQIAGRAGRHCVDGSFGTLAPLAMDPRLALDIESHRFRPVRRLVWRSNELDFSTIDALIASLRQRPRPSCFQLVEHADDYEALLLLARRADVRTAIRGESEVKLLWDVCQIPDFRKLLPEHHALLLGEILLQLLGRHARLEPDWLGEQLERLAGTGGSIDELLMRMEAVRTWSYVAHHAHWLLDAPHWQQRTQALEDALSEALHLRLVERFVERHARGHGPSGRRSRRQDRHGAAEPLDERPSNPFRKLAELRVRTAPGRAEERPISTIEAWVAELVDAAHDRFRIDLAGRIYDARAEPGEPGRPIATLVRGGDLLHPEVRLVLQGEPGAGARNRLQRRLIAFSRDIVAELVAPLRELGPAELGSSARGLVYQLEQGLGTVLWQKAEVKLAALTEQDRRTLASGGLVLGRWCALLPSALTPSALRLRMALGAAYHGRPLASEAPEPPALSLRRAHGVPPDLYTAMGYPVAGVRAVRADVAERVIAQLELLGEQGAFELPRAIGRWLGCGRTDVGAILRAWGFAPAGAQWTASRAVTLDAIHDGRNDSPSTPSPETRTNSQDP